MNSLRDRLLSEMGIKPVWRLREHSESADPDLSHSEESNGSALAHVSDAAGGTSSTHVPQLAPVAIASHADDKPSELQAASLSVAPDVADNVIRSADWPELSEMVAVCRKCRLCERRKQAVLGVGDRHADVMFVGEGPGAEEDERGEPFVGQAGKLLNAMLASVGLQRDQRVYIANAVKCRPPGNRTPEADELAACRPYLARQIELVQPRLIVALGRPAAQTLLNTEVKVGASRGKVFMYEQVPVVVTYHPSYLLRNLTDKAKAWEDFCFLMDELARLPAR